MNAMINLARYVLLWLGLLGWAGFLGANTPPPEVHAVYAQLTATLGVPDAGRRWPRLSLAPTDTGHGAYYDPSDNQIVLEPKAIAVCERLGERRAAALAFILAHELAHFAHHDGETMSRRFRFMDSQDRFSLRKGLEDKADVFGAITSELAGFALDDVVAPLLDQLYAAYHWQPNSSQYPPKAERQQVLTQALEKARQWIDLYDCGLLLLTLNQPEPARHIFDHLNQHYRSPETVYHHGVAYLLEVFSTATAEDLPYALPIELDRGYQLRGLKRTIGDQDRNRRRLRRAVHIFTADMAQMAPDYFPAYLACATAHLYLDDERGYASQLRRAAQLASSAKDRALLRILEGVRHARRGEREAARQAWQQAARLSQAPDIQAMTAHNLAYLAQGTPQRYQLSPPQSRGPQRQVGNYYVERIGSGMLRDPLRLEGGYQYLHGRKDGVLAQGLRGDTYVKLLRTRQHALDNRFAIGSSRTRVQQHFAAQPAILYPLRGGTMLVYPEEKLAIRFDAQDRMRAWTSFSILSN